MTTLTGKLATSRDESFSRAFRTSQFSYAQFDMKRLLSLTHRLEQILLHSNQLFTGCKRCEITCIVTRVTSLHRNDASLK